MGITGETEIANVLSTRSFVHFYNGHPYALPPPDLSQIKRVTIIGQGNVALDCARILLRPVNDLLTTDCPEPALDLLKNSAVAEVNIVGRRGILQASFTTKEIRELTILPGIDFDFDRDHINKAKIELGRPIYDGPGRRMKKRILDVLVKSSPSGQPRLGRLEFLKSPVAFLSNDRGQVKAVKWEVNELNDQERAIGSGQYDTIPTDLVLKSVGYRSVAMKGVPFEESLGIIPNDGRGRALEKSDETVSLTDHFV